MQGLILLNYPDPLTVCGGVCIYIYPAPVKGGVYFSNYFSKYFALWRMFLDVNFWAVVFSSQPITASRLTL